jgi:hypothetical protein
VEWIISVQELFSFIRCTPLSLPFHFVVVSFTVGSKICFEPIVLKV